MQWPEGKEMNHTPSQDQFQGEPELVPEASGRTWTLNEDFWYITDSGLRIEVPKGFKTDFASIPRILWRLFPPFGTYLRASIIHDFLYAENRAGRGRFSRELVDNIFYEASLDGGTSSFVGHILWMGVRAGGWAAWK